MVSHMKTTVDIPDDLLLRAKRRAIESRTSLRALIARGLRRELSEGGGRGARARRQVVIRWVTAPGGTPPGVNVADGRSLRQWTSADR